MEIEVRNGKIYKLRLSYEKDLPDYEITLVKSDNHIQVTFVDESIQQLDSWALLDEFSFQEEVAELIIKHKYELDPDIVAIAEEVFERKIRMEESSKKRFLDQMNDWKNKERKILKEATEERYQQSELINEIWKGDRKVLKVFKTPGTAYVNDTVREVEVLYDDGEKIEETYYSFENMNDYSHGYFDHDIDIDSLSPKKQEKIFKYKNNELVEFIAAPAGKYDGINTFRFIQYTDTYFFKDGKLLKNEYSFDSTDIDSIYKFEDNRIEYTSIDRDYDTNNITSENKHVMCFYDNSAMKEFKLYYNDKLVLEVAFDINGEETKKIAYDEEYKEYFLY